MKNLSKRKKDDFNFNNKDGGNDDDYDAIKSARTRDNLDFAIRTEEAFGEDDAKETVLDLLRKHLAQLERYLQRVRYTSCSPVVRVKMAWSTITIC